VEQANFGDFDTILPKSQGCWTRLGCRASVASSDAGQARLTANPRFFAVLLGTTLGVSALRADEAVEAAILRADKALYQGKLAGRNQCVGEAPLPPLYVPSPHRPLTAT
jgi:hypothetical protein